MSKDEFYVGYLPLGPRQKRFLVSVVTFLLVSTVVVSSFFAIFQNSPRDGVGWDPAGKGAIELQGVVKNHPYDLFYFEDLETREIRTAILTSMVKTSVSDRMKDFYGEPVNLKGVMTRQDGRFVFSVLNDKDAISKSDFDLAKLEAVTTLNLGKKNLKGEIIDPKCYIGAMKPGGGKVHKACAVLCIRGGIAPMFVTRDKFMRETYYLVTDESGDPLIEEIVPYVGDPIALSGEVDQRGDLLVLKLDQKTIRRL